MGCCEGRISHEKCLNIGNINPRYGSTGTSNLLSKDEKLMTKTDIDTSKSSKKIEIPKTKEVKIPSLKIPNDVVNTKKRLTLKIFESTYLAEGTILNINPGGLVGSERMAQDGLILFGTKNTEFENDFNFPDEDLRIGKRHFEIKYDISKDNYKIKNISGSGLYIKIIQKQLLRNNSIFSFSSFHISVKITLDPKYANDPSDAGESVNSFLNLKVIYGMNEGKEYHFESSTKNVIKIGRIQMTGIDMVFPDDTTSRLQTTIFYENNNWYIVDGDGIKESLNGTWYLSDEYTDLTEGMIFRAGTNSFLVHLYDP